MTSNINTTNIDGTFPIAGQDNDSQGFRTNFTNTKNNFVIAASEITSIQGNLLTRGQINDALGATIENVTLSAYNESFLDHGNVSVGTATLDFSQYEVHKITPTAAIGTLGLNWGAVGAGIYAKMRLWLHFDSIFSVTFPASVTVGTTEIVEFTGQIFTPFSIGDYILELSTVDGGTNVIVEKLLGPLSGDSGNISILQSDIVTLQNTMGNTAISGNVTYDITVLQGNIVTNTNDISVLQGDIVIIQSDIGNLQTNVSTVTSDLASNVVIINSNSSNIATINATAVFTNVATNQMGGNVIAGATASFINNGTASGNVTINYTDGDFQRFTLIGNTTISSFSNWPVTNRYAKLDLLFDISTNDAITFPAEVYNSGSMSGIVTISGVQQVVGNTVQSHASGSGPFVFELSTFDGGTNVYISQKIHP